MKTIRVIKGFTNFEQGHINVPYSEGKIYEIEDDKAADFIKMGVVELVKAVESAPENKAFEVSPDNKSKGKRNG